jgi:hypothetical protein
MDDGSRTARSGRTSFTGSMLRIHKNQQPRPPVDVGSINDSVKEGPKHFTPAHFDEDRPGMIRNLTKSLVL